MSFSHSTIASRRRHLGRPGQVSACVLAAWVCAACAPMSPPPATPPVAQAPAVVYVPSLAPEDLAVRQLLTYQVVLSKMNQADLAHEIGRLGDAPPSLEGNMKLALALGYTHVGGDVIRAQGLLDNVLADTSIEAQAWRGLAQLLAANYAEQRRINDQVDHLNQQLRDTQKDYQRKLDQLNEKLEALKSIERSINNRLPGMPGPFLSAPMTSPAPSVIPKSRP